MKNGRTSPPDGLARFEPPRPGLIALVVFVLAAATLCWPMLGGGFLLGDDQHTAGYGFRLFAAESLQQTGSVPQWNPYLFGGLPFVGAMHGDLFYLPTFALRWLLPLQAAMNLGFFLHLVLAGGTMYAFLRALRMAWGAALVGGVAYQLTGIVASMVNSGHDGKLYLSSLAPLAFLGLLAAIRHGRLWGYGALALVVGLGMFCHYQMTYYLLVACGLWTLWLVFLDPERRSGLRWPVALGAALGAVALGLAISAVQALPFLEYIPHSPRSTQGPSGGWAYATSWAMPVEETFTTILPQFNGVLANYWGQNFFKGHTEHLGASVVLLAVLGLTDRSRGKVRWALLGIGVLFLLVAWGGHTPFYRLWYEVMPMMKKVRAAGMAFYLPAFVTCVFAAFGTDRLLRGDVAPTRVLVVAGVLGAFALLGVVGALQPLAEGLVADPRMAPAVVANADALRGGALRLLVVVLAAGGIAWALAARRLAPAPATLALTAVVAADLWSIDRLYYNYKEPASELFAVDPVIAAMQRTKEPYRAWDPMGVYGGGGLQGGSILMAHRVPQILGYHGNELRYYDELLGGKGRWEHLAQGNPTILDLTAVRYIILAQEQELPGFHKVVGPVPTSGTGATGILYERDTVPSYARVLPAAVRAPEAQVAPTVVDPRFPYERVVIYADSASVLPEPIPANALPAPAATRARVAAWAPGAIRIALEGRDPKPAYLMVSENWYPDWRATVDGRPTPVHRADNTFLSVVLPPGAKEVRFEFHDPTYGTGKAITIVALLLTLGLLATGLLAGRVPGRRKEGEAKA